MVQDLRRAEGHAGGSPVLRCTVWAVTRATAVQLVGLALLAVGLGLWAVWLGVAVLGAGLLAFGLAAELGGTRRTPEPEAAVEGGRGPRRVA